MGISRGNCSKIQGLETVELCLDMKPKVTQVTLAERAHEEGVPQVSPPQLCESQHLSGKNLCRAQ